MKKIALLLLFLNLYFVGNSQNKADYYEQNEKINLYVFIGEKISIEEFNPNKSNTVKEYDSVEKDTILKTKYVTDRAFRVKYRIVKKVFNDLKTDIIEFIVYDHYGKPNFSKYKNVILYISKSTSGTYYFQQKYQYDVVYKNQKNEWFGYVLNKKSKKNEILNLKAMFTSKSKGVLKELFENINQK